MGNQKNGNAAIALLADFTIVFLVTIFLLQMNTSVETRFLLIFPCTVVFMQYVLGIYRPVLVDKYGVIAIAASILLSCSVSTVLVYVFMSGTDFERIKFLILWLPAVCLCLSLWRYYLKKNSLFVTKKQVIACNLNPDMSETMINYFRKSDHRYDSYLFLELSPGDLKKRLLEVSGSNMTTVIVYNVDLLTDNELAETLLRLRIEGVEIVTGSEFYGAITGKIWVSEQYKTHAIEAVLREGRSDSISVGISNLRNIFNIFFGIILLVLFVVPIFAVAVVVKLSSPGPVFFKQERIGKNKKEFNLYKFRTMVLDAESQGPKWATKSDGRVTPVGKILRELHLDELPQIINICKGDLHFVGPRPIRKYFADQLATQIPNYNLRFLVKPGLTGWAQTLGPYGENFMEQKEKFEFDLFYIANRNQISDIMITGLTVGKVFLSVRTLVQDYFVKRSTKKA